MILIEANQNSASPNAPTASRLSETSAISMTRAVTHCGIIGNQNWT